MAAPVPSAPALPCATSVPEFTVSGPVNVFAAESVRLPAPSFTGAKPAPDTTPLTVRSWPAPVVKVRLPESSTSRSMVSASVPDVAAAVTMSPSSVSGVPERVNGPARPLEPSFVKRNPA